MTRIQKIDNSQQRKPIITPTSTGIAATAALGITTARAFVKSKPINKTHKVIGILTALLTLFHIGTVGYYHHKYKKM